MTDGSSPLAVNHQTKAVIWDMDGVIADTAPYHFRAWQETFRQRGAHYSEAAFRRNFGKRNDAIIENVLGAGVPAAEVAAITAEKEELFRRRAAGMIKPLPGAIGLMRALREHGIPQAMGSSAPIENIEMVTRELGIKGFFQAIVSGREVAEGKPSPQVFLLAAKKLGVRLQDCLVIEDALAGVSAAKRAGMTCIAVTTSNPRAELGEADLVVDSLEEVTVDKLMSLFKG
ncbi:MAG: HAD family phosphatase [Dehalococcoidales bacterium]|nr:HAD family phosphatase [Dehalococcoidales bacterium]